MVVLILPSLFGLSLVGEGVYKLMAYDDRGWVGVVVGAVFLVAAIAAYFLISTGSIVPGM